MSSDGICMCTRPKRALTYDKATSLHRCTVQCAWIAVKRGACVVASSSSIGAFQMRMPLYHRCSSELTALGEVGLTDPTTFSGWEKLW